MDDVVRIQPPGAALLGRGPARLAFPGGEPLVAAGRYGPSLARERRLDGHVWIAFRLAAQGAPVPRPGRLVVAADGRRPHALAALTPEAEDDIVGVLDLAAELVERAARVPADLGRRVVPAPVHAEPDWLEGLLIEALSGLASTADTDPCAALFAEQAAGLLLVHVLRRHCDLSGFLARPRRGGLAGRRLRRCLEYLHEHLAADVGLADLAAAAGLSPSHFARAFKRATGVSPHRYLVARRIERAKGLLAVDDLPIAEVALACGFADQSHLTNTFKRLVGVTPAAYRRAG